MSDGAVEETWCPPAAVPDQRALSILFKSPDELGRFLNEFRPYLLTIAMAEIPNDIQGKVGASDVVQEAILKGLENYSQFRGSTHEEFAGWMRRILFRLMANFRDAYRSQKRDVALEGPADSNLVNPGQQSPSHVALTCEQRNGLEESMSKLPDAYREVILLRHRENLTFAEIGIRIQKSEEAARKTWTRAIEQLKQELSRSG